MNSRPRPKLTQTRSDDPTCNKTLLLSSHPSAIPFHLSSIIPLLSSLHPLLLNYTAIRGLVSPPLSTHSWLTITRFVERVKRWVPGPLLSLHLERHSGHWAILLYTTIPANFWARTEQTARCHFVTPAINGERERERKPIPDSFFDHRSLIPWNLRLVCLLHTISSLLLCTFPSPFSCIHKHTLPLIFTPGLVSERFFSCISQVPFVTRKSEKGRGMKGMILKAWTARRTLNHVFIPQKMKGASKKWKRKR